MNIFINGFGRIGRTVARILLERGENTIVGINDIVGNPHNLAYLLNYDSNYGRLPEPATVAPDGKSLIVGKSRIPLFCHTNFSKLSWNSIGADVVIDSSGVKQNVINAASLRNRSKLQGVIVTHSPTSGIDRHIVMGVNDSTYNPATDFVVSSSICDANAIAHPLKLIHDQFGIAAGSVTTLHPWLGYQNLTDAAVQGQAKPGHYWPDYSLGRSSVGMLIPKNTTAVKALEPILADVPRKLHSMSFRIPTSVVTSADMTLMCEREITLESLEAAFRTAYANSPYVKLNYESLISADYERCTQSAIIDMQWLKVSPNGVVKVILWYDNEWGYACRAIDTAKMICSRQAQGDSK